MFGMTRMSLVSYIRLQKVRTRYSRFTEMGPLKSFGVTTTKY